jgi:hypothetical protein
MEIPPSGSFMASTTGAGKEHLYLFLAEPDSRYAGRGVARVERMSKPLGQISGRLTLKALIT